MHDSNMVVYGLNEEKPDLNQTMIISQSENGDGGVNILRSYGSLLTHSEIEESLVSEKSTIYLCQRDGHFIPLLQTKKLSKDKK